MNISHYHNLQRKLQAFKIYTLLSTSSLTNIAKLPALKITAFGQVQLCGDKDCASYYFAKISNVTVNTLYLADLGLFYSETNTDAKLWDCDQSSHHNRQGQGKVHKMKQSEAVHLDLTLSQMKGWCAGFFTKY